MNVTNRIGLNPDQRNLFIVGHARSGTTIMGDLLNSSSSVELFAELNGFLLDWNREFIREFNERHGSNGYMARKGYYIPPTLGGMTPQELLDHRKQCYRYVGEKIAFGPHGIFAGNSDAQEYFLSFHNLHYLSANYIFTMRSPMASLVSMRKLFPSHSCSQLLFGWLRSMEVILSASFLFPHCAIVPLERLSEPLVDSILSALGIRGRFASNWIVPSQDHITQKSFGKLDLVSQSGTAAERSEDDYLSACEELYKTIIDTIDNKSLWFKNETVPAAFDDLMIPQCRALAAELNVAIPDANVMAGLVRGTLQHAADLGARNINRFVSERIREAIFDDSSGNLFERPGEMNNAPWVCNDVFIGRNEVDFTVTLKPDGHGNKHFGQHLILDVGKIATMRISVRPSSCSYVMLQLGSEDSYINATYDLVERRVLELNQRGNARAIVARVVPTGSTNCQLIISGLIASPSAWAWIYLLGPNAEVEYEGDTGRYLYVSDPFLSFRPNEAGVSY